MSAVEEYRKWCAKHYRESVGFDLADAAIAELEAENKSQVEKTIEARQETHLAIIQKREAEAERDKWEWVARDACRELAYETHVNPQSPLDYRLAHLPPLPAPPSGYIRGYSHDCKGELHGDDSSVPYPAREDGRGK